MMLICSSLDDLQTPNTTPLTGQSEPRAKPGPGISQRDPILATLEENESNTASTSLRCPMIRVHVRCPLPKEMTLASDSWIVRGSPFILDIENPSFLRRSLVTEQPGVPNVITVRWARLLCSIIPRDCKLKVTLYPTSI